MKRTKSKRKRVRVVDVTPGWMTYLNGQRAYRAGDPCPVAPTNENCNEAPAGMYYGWMMARAADVGLIFKVIDICGIRNTKRGDRLTRTLVDILDKHRKTNSLDPVLQKKIERERRE